MHALSVSFVMVLIRVARPVGGFRRHTVVQTSALRESWSPAEIGQRSALTGQGSAPSDGGVTIFPPDPNLTALRLELARLRGERGWTYDELASRSGLSRRTLIEVEQGRTIGSLKTWHALAHALDVPVDHLFATLCEGHAVPGDSTE